MKRKINEDINLCSVSSDELRHDRLTSMSEREEVEQEDFIKKVEERINRDIRALPCDILDMFVYESQRDQFCQELINLIIKPLASITQSGSSTDKHEHYLDIVKMVTKQIDDIVERSAREDMCEHFKDVL